jgi:hypothetical protein
VDTNETISQQQELAGETIGQPVKPEIAAEQAAAGASRAAIEQFTSENGGAGKKAGRGRPKKYPSADEKSLFGNRQAVGAPTGNEIRPENNPPPDPPLDDATIEAGVEGIAEILNTVGTTIVGIVAKKNNCTAQETQDAQDQVKVPELMKKGGKLCAKKYARLIRYAPEMMLGGGFLLWLGSITLTCKSIVANAPKNITPIPQQN